MPQSHCLEQLIKHQIIKKAEASSISQLERLAITNPNFLKLCLLGIIPKEHVLKISLAEYQGSSLELHPEPLLAKEFPFSFDWLMKPIQRRQTIAPFKRKYCPRPPQKTDIKLSQPHHQQTSAEMPQACLAPKINFFGKPKSTLAKQSSQTFQLNEATPALPPRPPKAKDSPLTTTENKSVDLPYTQYPWV